MVFATKEMRDKIFADIEKKKKKKTRRIKKN